MARTPPPRRPTDDDDDEDWSSSEEEPSKRDATVVISSDEEVGVVVASFPIRIHRLSSAFFGPAMREPLPPVTQSRMLDNLFTSESEGDVVGRGGLGMGEKEEVGAPGRMGSRLSVRSGNIPRPLDRLFTSESETEAVSAAATSRPKPLEKLFTSESEDAAQAKKPRVREMQREIPALQRRARPKYHYVVSSDSEDEVEEVALEELFSRTTISGGGRAVVGKSAASKGRGRAPKKGASTFILDGVRVDGDESSDEEVEEEGTDEFDSFINDEVVEDSEGTEEDDEATSGTEESTGVPKPRGLVTEIIDLLSSSEDEADDGEVEDDRPEDDGDSEDSLDSFIVNDDDSPRKKSLPKPPPETPRPKAPEVSKRVFDSSKTATAEAFLLELDAVLADGAVGRHYESRGGMRLKWNPKLLKTAGVAFVGRGEIELSTKVITSIDRLHNTTAHEYCHLAAWVNNGEQRRSDGKHDYHGAAFKYWGAKASREFSHLGVHVTTKHSYEIEYKYHSSCENNPGCTFVHKTHSKPRDLGRYRCPKCHGRLVQTKPSPRELSEYTMFAKNNLARLKRENPGTPMKDVMALVGKRWKVYKEGQGLGRDDRDESPTAQGGRGNAVVVISDSEGDSPAVDGVGVLMNDLKL